MDDIANMNAYPFRKPGTNAWWRTRDVMNTYSGKNSRAWGYYYPEFATPVTPQDLVNKVRAPMMLLNFRAPPVCCCQ
jgi:hypothetical protein